MSPNRKPAASVVCGLSCLHILLSCYGIYGTATDTKCLRRIFESFKDPNGYLNVSWNLNNRTEGAICRFNGIECWHPYEDRVLNIKLADMGLSGQFPLGIEDCTSLTGLDLSGNNLNGSLPLNISKYIGLVTNLDLSYNEFSGSIPVDLANCTYLNDLNLDYNKFSGQIPLELGSLTRIKSFSVANNNLSGPIPNFLVHNHIAKDSYANNSGLCGVPLDTCPTQNKSHLSSIAGGAAGGLTSIIILTGIAIFYISKMKIIRKLEDPEGNRWAKSMKGTKGVKVKIHYLCFMFSLCPKLIVTLLKPFIVKNMTWFYGKTLFNGSVIHILLPSLNLSCSVLGNSIMNQH